MISQAIPQDNREIKCSNQNVTYANIASFPVDRLKEIQETFINSAQRITKYEDSLLLSGESSIYGSSKASEHLNNWKDFSEARIDNLSRDILPNYVLPERKLSYNRKFLNGAREKNCSKMKNKDFEEISNFNSGDVTKSEVFTVEKSLTPSLQKDFESRQVIDCYTWKAAQLDRDLTYSPTHRAFYTSSSLYDTNFTQSTSSSSKFPFKFTEICSDVSSSQKNKLDADINFVLEENEYVRTYKLDALRDSSKVGSIETIFHPSLPIRNMTDCKEDGKDTKIALNRVKGEAESGKCENISEAHISKSSLENRIAGISVGKNFARGDLIAVDGKGRSPESICREREMLKKWREEDNSFWKSEIKRKRRKRMNEIMIEDEEKSNREQMLHKLLKEEDDSDDYNEEDDDEEKEAKGKKIIEGKRRKMIEKQIEEANEYYEKYGVWIEKGWKTGAGEAEMWEEGHYAATMKGSDNYSEESDTDGRSLKDIKVKKLEKTRKAEKKMKEKDETGKMRMEIREYDSNTERSMDRMRKDKEIPNTSIELPAMPKVEARCISGGFYEFERKSFGYHSKERKESNQKRHILKWGERAITDGGHANAKEEGWLRLKGLKSKEEDEIWRMKSWSEEWGENVDDVMCIPTLKHPSWIEKLSGERFRERILSVGCIECAENRGVNEGKQGAEDKDKDMKVKEKTNQQKTKGKEHMIVTLMVGFWLCRARNDRERKFSVSSNESKGTDPPNWKIGKMRERAFQEKRKNDFLKISLLKRNEGFNEMEWKHMWCFDEFWLSQRQKKRRNNPNKEKRRIMKLKKQTGYE
ncbi:uncharacterized protein MONOS_5199 [Monocercomonoides exilis]|uniref:uncharacterized protein n=1 Tax=Monocercomonoides exilis TaxID=2049356 RepID=UPI00355A72DB|nr:hypothetical protein MONOS_5199 [Monocercomonoides exilis]|eukprot:MONOS_5199.1-p1 / transcript=MONOS_5199.1 / gene=MONOS_5199 / organism=Monocercomonoides_exilis_PA203 / gene_product=unspecified product / transcript_product=unspecified product / location=Mono_scaffold00148:103125-105651(+) / protein_length=810 / sequence_SO=supercontig / SO=protein_coding / is_pseudo=false